jgi:hypothetical protein
LRLFVAGSPTAPAASGRAAVDGAVDERLRLPMALAAKDKHEFQKWIIGAIEGQPYKGGKKGMDRGDLSVAEP